MLNISEYEGVDASASKDRSPPIHRFAPWKTIKIGTFKNSRAILAELVTAGIRLNKPTAELIISDEFTTAAEETDVELVVVKVAELGFQFGATFGEICSRAAEIGLKLCPAEIGPQLRLQYLDQPRDHSLRIAMKAIGVSRRDPRIFVVRNRDESTLMALDGDVNAPWFSGSHFVFARK